MLRLQSALTQIDAFAARLFPETNVQTKHAIRVRKETPVTANCIPHRRRRMRRPLTSNSADVPLSTWF